MNAPKKTSHKPGECLWDVFFDMCLFYARHARFTMGDTPPICIGFPLPYTYAIPPMTTINSPLSFPVWACNPAKSVESVPRSIAS